MVVIDAERRVGQRLAVDGREMFIFLADCFGTLARCKNFHATDVLRYCVFYVKYLVAS